MLWYKKGKNEVDEQVPYLPEDEGIWNVGFQAGAVHMWLMSSRKLIYASSLSRGSSSPGDH